LLQWKGPRILFRQDKQDKKKWGQMTGKNLDFKALEKGCQTERLSMIFYDIT